MFSKAHVEILIKRARTGQEIDLNQEVEYFQEVKLELPKDAKIFLENNGSLCMEDSGTYLLYESHKYKIERL